MKSPRLKRGYITGGRAARNPGEKEGNIQPDHWVVF